MADAGVSVVLSKLSELASAEATALLKVDGQIRTLGQRLGYLQAVVRGADQQRRGRASELLLLWVRETREVAFDVEDAVDEFHLKVETFQLKLKWGNAWYRSAVKLLHGLAMQIIARHVLSREITKINERIKEIDRIKDTYNIGSTPSEIWSVSFNDDDTTWDIEDGSVELRRDEFTSLKKSILDKDEMISHRAVISIIGPSGSGKTRLARNLYNDHDIQEHFEVLAWICLPPCIRFQQYVDMIYAKIRPQVLKENMESGTVSVRQNSRELKELLKEPKYLVVLDGVLDIGHWNSFLDLLPSCNAKSRILVTSKLSTKEIKHADKKVAPMELHPLDIGQTCELFYERVFGAVSLPSWARVKTRGVHPWSVVPPGTVTSLLNFRVPATAFGSPMPMENGDNTIEFNERVQNISRGLPLAAAVLGGILRAKDYSSEWLDLLSEKLETSKGQPKAVRCLWSLAFEDLPHHLKSCFLYLATAPENMLLDPDRLVRLWMAEGFISPKKSRTLEEVGLGYLKELVCRGLVEVVEKDARGGIKMVALHSLLHSFAQSEAQECSFLDIHHHANVLNPHVVRRLAIHNFLDSFIDIPDQFPKLRSLFCDFLEDSAAGPVSERDCDGLVQQQSHWSNMAEWFLRACGCSSGPSGSTKLHQLSIIRSSRFLRVIDLHGLLLARVPDEIGSIIHLRYLGVRNCRLQGLPESIFKLDNLQTLDVRKTQVTSVTDGLWEISVLRHVLAETLHLSTRSPSARTMKNLQTLVGAEPDGEWQLDSCPLNNMIYLRTLAMGKVLEQHVDALSSALQKMEYLVSLSLSGRLLPVSVFSNSSSRRLEVLTLDGRLNSLPTCPFNLPNLGKLTMSGSSNLLQDFVDQVSTMPNLTEMEFLDGSYVGAEMVIREDGFPSLTKLNLANLEKLDKLELVPGSAPKLAVLTKCGCTKMELIDNRLPQSAGHQEMPSVQETENPQIPVLAVTDRRFDLTDVNMSRSFEDWGSSLQPKQTGTTEISVEEQIVCTEVSIQDMLVSVE